MNIADQIKEYTASRIQRILTDPSESTARAVMARLRRGIGHKPGELPELWGEFLLYLPESLFGHGEPSRAEWAIYIALTMFALHQQSRDRKAEPMHRPGISLGSAANRLMDSEDDRERIARRFYPAATASDMMALSHHLRGLVTLLREKNIPLDYVRLASDLYFFQNPDIADRVRLRWGEDFCSSVKENKNDDKKEG